MIRNAKIWAAFALAAMATPTVRAQEPTPEPAPATKTTTEKLKEKAGNAASSVKRGVGDAGAAIKNKFTQAKDHVGAMEVEARVYARLHWDKVLTGAKIDLSAPRKGVIVLTGTVPDAKAADKAVSLTSDTVGVTEAVNHLTVATGAAVEVK